MHEWFKGSRVLKLWMNLHSISNLICMEQKPELGPQNDDPKKG